MRRVKLFYSISLPSKFDIKHTRIFLQIYRFSHATYRFIFNPVFAAKIYKLNLIETYQHY